MPRASLPVLGAAVVVLAAGSTAAVAAASGGLQDNGRSAICAAPALPGPVVDVTLADMGNMMGGGRTGSGNSMMGNVGVGPPFGSMRLVAAPGGAVAGPVSFRVHNVGTVTHELVVLPARAGQVAGRRPVEPDARVAEAGSRGEASRDCGPGAGKGIPAGATGWVTLTLTPGSYELVCNLPGHYAAGMSSNLLVQ